MPRKLFVSDLATLAGKTCYPPLEDIKTRYKSHRLGKNKYISDFKLAKLRRGEISIESVAKEFNTDAPAIEGIMSEVDATNEIAEDMGLEAVEGGQSNRHFLYDAEEGKIIREVRLIMKVDNFTIYGRCDGIAMKDGELIVLEYKRRTKKFKGICPWDKVQITFYMKMANANKCIFHETFNGDSRSYEYNFDEDEYNEYLSTIKQTIYEFDNPPTFDDE